MYSELNRTSITTLVDDSYTDMRRDSLLQPIFDGAGGTNWGPHLERMVDFWCSVMLASGDFKDKVCGTHMQLQGIEADHFRRWLSLFETHVQRLFHVEVAEETRHAGHRFATSASESGRSGTPEHATGNGYCRGSPIILRAT